MTVVQSVEVPLLQPCEDDNGGALDDETVIYHKVQWGLHGAFCGPPLSRRPPRRDGRRPLPWSPGVPILTRPGRPGGYLRMAVAGPGH